MSVIYPKDSFDRFGDDLMEVLLSFISFEDCFHFRGVSKQWKRLIFNKQNKLIITNKSKINFIENSKKAFNLKVIESVLKNCPKITSIYFDYTYNSIDYKSVVNIDSTFDFIINYCNNLSEIIYNYEFDYLSKDIFNKFVQKFGLNIKIIHFKSISERYKYNTNKDILKFCPNLTHLSVNRLKTIFDGNDVLMKKLKLFQFIYRTEDKSRIETFVENYKNSLEVISVGIEGDVNESDFNVLFNSLSKLKKLKSFSFTIDFGLKGIFLITKLEALVKSCKLLKKLNFDFKFQSNEVINRFFSTLNEFKCLETLKLDFNKEMDINFPITSQLFSELKNLKHLKIQIFMISNLIVLDTFFESIDKHLPKLQSIQCNKTDITEKSFKCLSKLPELKSIKLEFDSEFKFNEWDIKELIRNNRNINNICIKNNSIEICVRDENIIEFRNGKDFSIFTDLEMLSSSEDISDFEDMD